MTTIFVLADNKCCVRVITDKHEVPKIMKDFEKPWHRWEDLSGLNKPGGCIMQHDTSPEYQRGQATLSITRIDI